MNNIKIKILDNNKNIIFSTIEEKDAYLIENINTTSKSILDKNGNKFRAGVLKNNQGIVYATSQSKDHIKSSKTFLSDINAIGLAINFFINSKNEIENNLNTNTKRLLHNISSINGHNIQEIYSLVSQDILAQRMETQVEIFESYIKENSRECALSFLRIAKNNFSIKNEFSVFNKLFDKNNKLQEKNHNVHRVMMNSLYHFFPDFSEKSVKVLVYPSHLTAYFDYECIHVVFFYLIENAVKYVLPRSTVTIEIKDDNHFSLISFKMTSLQIKENEVSKIFEEGFSGEIPNKIGSAGKGIGLSLAKKIVSLNGGDIIFRTNSEDINYNDNVPYQENEFLIYLKERQNNIIKL